MNIRQIFVTIFTVCLLIGFSWYLYENNKPLNEKIAASIEKYDNQFEKIITIQFYSNRPYVFYNTVNNTLKVVLLESNAIKGVTVKKQMSETSMITDGRQVSWSGISDANGSNFLYGVIDNPDITQLLLESEANQPAIIIKVENNKSIWFRFLDDDVKTPVIITATDKEGNEQYYFGPQRSGM